MNLISMPRHRNAAGARLHRALRGVNVPVGEVSDMPQPSQSRQPASFSKLLLHRDSGRGAPPDEQNLSEEKSIVSMPGRLSSATCIVGTPA